MSTNTQHAVLSASGTSRWMKCPGSIRLAAQLKPRDHRSPYAEEGTIAHMLFEQCMNLDTDAGGFIGTTLTTPDHTALTVPEEMADAVQIMLNHCRGLRTPFASTGVETRVKLDLLTRKHGIAERAFGTVDFWAVADGALHVVDYKHGKGVPVQVENNTQCMYYALGLVYGLANPPNEVVITIVQPRADHIEGPVRSRRMPTLDLRMWGEDVLAPAMKATQLPDSKLNAGTWCRFCNCAAQCPALHQLAQTTAQDEFGGEITLSSTPKKLTDAQLAQVLNKEKILRHWLDAVRAEASSRIEDGQRIPGWKLAEKRAARYWKLDAIQTEKALLDTYPEVDIKHWWETKLKSVAQIEKTCVRLGLDFDEIESDYVDKKSSGTTLVPDSDPRKAITKQATEFGSTDVSCLVADR